MNNYTIGEINAILYDNVDALLVISAKEDIFRVLKVSDTFSKYISSEGSYKELVEKLLFHMSENNEKIADDYLVFLPKIGEFKGKYSKKINAEINGVRHLVQMIVCPIEKNEGDYVMVLCDLDKSESDRTEIADNKAKTMQEAYLFSMYVDLNKDLTSSINVTEISNDDMHYDVKYTEWRMMIVNMIWPENQELFLEKSNPEYLRTHLKPGKTLSFDCQMKNLQGMYIWVKLIFGRTDTTSEDDFRFVFMVENIHESSMKLFGELKKFENLASYDALTGVYNHGRIETELNNAISRLKQGNMPISLMMLDIDYFKKVNDTYGHAAGDEILKEFVSTVNSVISKSDIKMGRWGGEEFVCVCYGVNMDSLKSIAEETRATVEAKVFDKVGTMTCSIGLASLTPNDAAIDAFERLDKALYEAKSGGRNCVKAFE